MKDFKELKVWSKAHELTIAIYGLTRTFPREEIYGLTSQVRRSAASIGANIAEGCGRRSDGEMTRFLQIQNAVGFARNWFEQRMLVFDFHFAMAALDEFGNELHRAGPVKRDERGDVLDRTDLEFAAQIAHP